MGEIRIVCFDLGGVLVRIGQTWGEMAQAAGVASALDPDIKRGDFDPFVKYEEGSISYAEYIAELGGLLKCSQQEAQQIHSFMLIEPYPETEPLVAEIHARGLATGCLSNTNAPHWDVLTSDRFPAIRDLQLKLASFQVSVAKPSPEIYREFETKYGFACHEIAFFDDALANVEAANACGWNATWIDLHGHTASQVRSKLVELGAL